MISPIQLASQEQSPVRSRVIRKCLFSFRLKRLLIRLICLRVLLIRLLAKSAGVFDAVFVLSERKLSRRPGAWPFRIKRFPKGRLSVGI